jgi:transposase
MKPRPRREKYTAEFKMEAVRLMQIGNKDVTQLARELDVPRQYLHAWFRQAAGRQGKAPNNVFPGNGNLTAEDAELGRLRKEVAQLKEDNEILKKATAFFAKNAR